AARDEGGELVAGEYQVLGRVLVAKRMDECREPPVQIAELRRRKRRLREVERGRRGILGDDPRPPVAVGNIAPGSRDHDENERGDDPPEETASLLAGRCDGRHASARPHASAYATSWTGLRAGRANLPRG